MSNQKNLDELFLETMEAVVMEKIAALEDAPEAEKTEQAAEETEKVAGMRKFVRGMTDKMNSGTEKAAYKAKLWKMQGKGKKAAQLAGAGALAAGAGYGAYRAVKALKNRKKKK